MQATSFLRSTTSVSIDTALRQTQTLYSSLNFEAKETEVKKLKKESEDLQEKSQALKQTAINTIAMLGTAVLGGALLFEASLILIGAAAGLALAIGTFAWKHFNHQARLANEAALSKTQLLTEYKAIDTPQELKIEPYTKEYQVSGYRKITFSCSDARLLVFSYDRWVTKNELAAREGQPLIFCSEILKPGDSLEFNIQTTAGNYLRGYEDDFVIRALET